MTPESVDVAVGGTIDRHANCPGCGESMLWQNHHGQWRPFCGNLLGCSRALKVEDDDE